VLVDPGLAILASNTNFVIINGTDEDAEVAFDPEAFQPQKDAQTRDAAASYARLRYALRTAVTIGRRSAAAFTTKQGPYYFEYEVRLTTSNDCAEGNSKPGGFVDP
jgi:hypothetical protein